MGLFNRKPKEAPVEQEPMTEQTSEQEDRSQTCRACSNGWGDGICEYHANQFRRMAQRFEKIDRKR